MNSDLRHRGWLLVYEFQLWLVLAAFLLAGLLAGNVALAIGGLVFFAPLIYSLYVFLPAIPKIHLWVNALAAAGIFYQELKMLPRNMSDPAEMGAFIGALVTCVLYTTWATYWRTSTRVNRAYANELH